MIEKITDQNLERYDSRLKEWCDRKFFEKGDYGKYETTEEASAVAFYPAPNTPLKGKVKFSFKETPPASGDKGPDNPSTITGVAQAKVTRRGKNIIPYPFYDATKTLNGVTFINNGDGSVTANGTASNTAQFYFNKPYWATNGGEMIPSGTYRLSGCPTGGAWNTYKIKVVTSNVNSDYFTSPSDTGDGSTVVLSKAIIVSYMIEISSGTTVSNLVFKPQLELGTTATSFEKYEGSDATINLGSTYYGGEIDLATGLMTVTHAEATLTGNEAWSLSSDSTDSISIFGASSVLSYTPEPASGGVCTHIPLYSGPNVLNSFRVYTNKAVILRLSATDFPDVSTLQAWMQTQNSAGNPVKITYTLATPYTVPLTPTQILSLSQTDKYTPRLNTVYTDADSIQISYLKSPIRDEYEKTQAILSLGGNS